MTSSSLRSDKSFDSITTRRLAKQLHKIGVALADLGDIEERIVAASADLKYSTLVSEFEERHPERFFQFGISERNMIGAAAGMASCGLLPYVGTFASFSGLLAYENIRTDLAYPQMPVRILATHSGISMGYFATSHHATEDLSALRSVADLVVLSPADGTSGAELLRQTVHHPLPIYFRLSRGRDETLYEEVPPGYKFGTPHVVRSGTDLLIVATGLMVRNSAVAADELLAAGARCTVMDVHTIKPFAGDSIAELAARHSAVLIVEEHNVEGGLGTLVQEALGARGLRVPTYKHGLYDEFSIIGPPNHLYEYYGIDPFGIATVARRVLASLPADTFFKKGPSLRLWTDEDRHRVLRAVQERSPTATKAAVTG